MYECVHVHMPMCTPGALRCQKRLSHCLELESQMSEQSVGTSALNSSAISCSSSPSSQWPVTLMTLVYQEK